MGCCHRLDDKGLHVVCPCGYEYIVWLDDMVVEARSIVLPVCPDCQLTRVSLSVAHIPEDVEKKMTVRSRDRHVINQSLYKRLVARGGGAEDRSVEDIPSDCLRLASDSDVLEAPLHRDIAVAREKRKRGRGK